MPRETSGARAARATLIWEVLQRTYPDAHCELEYSNPLELLIATILSAQTTDRQVNRVTRDLFQKYRTAEDYAGATEEALAEDLKRIGLFRNKARSVRGCCRALLERHGGQVPQTMEELTELSGVGRKTANVVLSNAFGRHLGVVVDTHVERLSHRLKLSSGATPAAIEKDLMRLAPQAWWGQASHWLIWHGRRRCMARNPECEACELRDLCPSSPRATAVESKV